MDGLFEHLGHDGELNVDYGKIKKMPKNDSVTDEDIELFANTIFQFATTEELMEDLESDLDTVYEDGTLI